MMYRKAVKRVNSKGSRHEENVFIFFLFSLSVHDKIRISWNYYSHFTTYIKQTFMLYALNLNSDVCELFLNDTEKKRSTLL